MQAVSDVTGCSRGGAGTTSAVNGQRNQRKKSEDAPHCAGVAQDWELMLYYHETPPKRNLWRDSCPSQMGPGRR
eukprot:397691-Amphidinium_carterae.1